MKNAIRSGRICVFASAVIFGFTPVLAAISYQNGNNGINMAFLRAAVPLPLLVWLGRHAAFPRKKQWQRGLMAGCLSFACTLMLYSSYEYISPGLATTLHFLYPLYVTAYESAKNRIFPGRRRLLSLSLGVAGAILCCCGADLHGSALGYLLALGSGICYALYIIQLDREASDPLPLYRLMLAISFSGLFLCGFLGLALGKLTFSLTATGWLCAAAVALLTAVLGCVLFQRGVRAMGPENAAIYSLLEPMTSIFFSAALLKDNFSPQKLIGCLLILISLFLVSNYGKKTDKERR